ERVIFPAVEVPDRHARAEADLVVRHVRDVDAGDLRHARREVVEAGLDEALPLLGGLVLRVLTEIAVLHGDLDPLGQLDIELVHEALDLVLDPGANLLEHGAPRCTGAGFGRADGIMQDAVPGRAGTAALLTI